MAYFEFPHTRNYDSDLGWLIKEVKSYSDAIAALDEWKETAEVRIEDLEAFYDLLKNGELPEAVAQALTDWMQKNALDLVGRLVKHVFFGLTDSGYFVAYIPENWRDLIFKTTGYDITLEIQPEYGHLVLIY